MQENRGNTRLTGSRNVAESKIQHSGGDGEKITSVHSRVGEGKKGKCVEGFTVKWVSV